MVSTTGMPAPPRAGELTTALRRALRGQVRDDSYTRHLFSTDASMYAIEPLAVAFPRDADDVAAAVAVARKAGVPVLPRGAGTSLAGQTVGAAVILDLSRHMTGILAIDPERRTARVQPGVVQDDLNRAAAAHGLVFGPDTSTSSRATLGGMIGNNSGGSRSVRLGMTIDHVRSLDVVLSDASTALLAPIAAADLHRRSAGSSLEAALYRELPALITGAARAIAEDYPPYWRRSGGYRLDRLAADLEAGRVDLARFLVGSEGTLATVTEAEVDLVPLPGASVIAVGHFASTAAAIAATDEALAVEPAAVELMDKAILDLSRSKLEYASLGSMLIGDPGALLYVTLTGDTLAEAVGRLDRLEAAWRRGGHGYAVLRAVTPAEQAALIRVRKAGLGLLMASSVGPRRPLAFVEDTAVPPEHLAEYTARFAELLTAHGLSAGFYGHASVGCLHVRPFLDLTEPGAVATMRAVAGEVQQLCAEYGGSNSSEHGDGLARSEFNRVSYGDELYEAFRRVKGIFDPDGRMNPGKIVDAPAMTDNLRDLALPPAGPLTTVLDFSGAGGMRGAADRCMNIGVCRKSSTGVMCPSYMATREEEHSTRGRANALVLALSTPDPERSLGSERLHEILDLCVECKACKSECPLGVDMAAMKSEFLHHYQREHGVPLRSRVFGAIRSLNRLGAVTAPLSNLPGRVPPVRIALDRMLGITARRPLPRFQRDSLPRWFARRPEPAGPFPRGEVILLADSFTTYTEPDVGKAAVELLEAAGWRVTLEAGGCCGRAAISKGLLDDARALAEAMTARLAPAAARGVPIVGVEPSCVLTLAEEHRSLQPGSEAAASVGSRARLVEDLLLEALDDGSLVLNPASPASGQRIVFHGHCHQKAVTGTAKTVELLRRIPGAEVIELDAGCCGMAGSFGYESEHYEISISIGAQRLFPAVYGEPRKTLLAATGTSCRQQIEHGTGRQARHPVQLLRDALAAEPPQVPLAAEPPQVPLAAEPPR
ncbi:MAG: FAD-binding protein [Actinomycetota bacterium]|nr:FAD-binding protein [Actinomycetota bacterium]